MGGYRFLFKMSIRGVKKWRDGRMLELPKNEVTDSLLNSLINGRTCNESAFQQLHVTNWKDSQIQKLLINHMELFIEKFPMHIHTLWMFIEMRYFENEKICTFIIQNLKRINNCFTNQLFDIFVKSDWPEATQIQLIKLLHEQHSLILTMQRLIPAKTKYYFILAYPMNVVLNLELNFIHRCEFLPFFLNQRHKMRFCNIHIHLETFLQCLFCKYRRFCTCRKNTW